MIQPGEIQQIELVDKLESKHPDPSEFDTIEKKLKAAGFAQVTKPVSATCNTQYHAVHNSGTRPLSEIDLVVMHATQGGTARSVASYFASQDSGGSAHLTVDDYDCYRSLRDDEIPWGAPGANYHGFHIEQCGWSSWLRSMWSNTHRKTITRAAYKTAFHCKRYGIQRRFLTHDQLARGMRDGITTHWECTQAFGGDHTDPGNGWPRLLFMTLVKSYYASLAVRRNV
jgi:N-acetylmuramoyl-L-alanine amidase